MLQGPSGSGKTTLINLLGLLDRADKGEVLLEGRPVSGMDEDQRADARRDLEGRAKRAQEALDTEILATISLGLSRLRQREFPQAARELEARLRE